jgi:hypothetical protein
MAKKGEKKQSKAASAKTESKKKSAASVRVRKATKKQIKQKVKKDTRSRGRIIGSFRLAWHSLRFIRTYWRPLGGIVLVYGFVNLIFASGIVGSASSVAGDFNSKHFSDALSGFGAIISGGSSSQTPAMQSILLIIESLVIIWALRHLFSNEEIKIKDAYYHSTAPLIPFVLVIFVIVLQLLPITLGSAVLAIVLSSIAGNSAVEIIFTSLFIVLSFWSIYMVTSSIFALYIVTLPNMHPRSALKSAKNLVRFRRWQIVRRLLFLPLFIIIFMGIFIVPLILYAKFLVVPTFFVFSMLTILFAHTYLYSLYKGLLE